jgi:integrase
MPRRRARGEGTILKRKYTREDGTSYFRYYARVTATWDGKKQRYKPGPMRETEKEAKADLIQLQKLSQRGELGVGGKQRLSEYLESWLQDVAVKRKYGGYRAYYQSVHAYLIPGMGHMRLDQIKTTHVQTMLNDLFKELRKNGRKGESVVRHAKATLGKALEDAITLGILPTDSANPCRRVEIPAETTKPMTVWTPEEAGKFLTKAKDTYLYPIIYTALTSGMREGELCALRWRDVEPIEVDGRKLLRLHVRNTLITVPKRHTEVAKLKMRHLYENHFLDVPKTKKSLGSVLVAEDTRELLEEHRAKQKELAKDKRYTNLELVFPHPNGTPYAVTDVLKAYKEIFTDSGIPYITFHELRDSHASLLQNLTGDVAVVSERLRHSKKSTTVDKYVHTLTSARLDGVVTLEQLFKLKKAA